MNGVVRKCSKIESLRQQADIIRKAFGNEGVTNVVSNVMGNSSNRRWSIVSDGGAAKYPDRPISTLDELKGIRSFAEFSRAFPHWDLLVPAAVAGIGTAFQYRWDVNCPPTSQMLLAVAGHSRCSLSERQRHKAGLTKVRPVSTIRGAVRIRDSLRSRRSSRVSFPPPRLGV